MSEPGLQTLLGRADAALTLGRAEEAERAARGALAIEPANPTGHALLTRALLLQAKAEEALRAAEAGVGACPDSEWLHRLRALSLRKLGKNREALAAADEAVRIAPDVPETHHARSLVLEALKRKAEAREASERAISLAPHEAPYHAQLGDLWVDTDAAVAEGHYRESLRLDPSSAAVLNNLGVALLRQKQTREAALAFRSAVLLDPTLEVAKQNTHASARRLLGGGAALSMFFVITNAARLVSHVDGDLRPAGAGLALLLIVVGGTIWFVRKHLRMKRLAEEEPQLHAIYVTLEAERKAGRLKV